jgi:exosortase A-associated hydrolase 2
MQPESTAHAGPRLREEPFFIDVDDQRIFAMHFGPTDTARGRGVVLCPAFAEEASVSQRVVVNFGRHLAMHGYDVIRFDYSGTGDSSGDFPQVTVDTSVRDVCAVARVLADRCGGRVTAAGLRWGAMMGALASQREEAIDSVLLWEPVTDLRRFLMSFLRLRMLSENAAGDGTALTRDQLVASLEAGQCVDVLTYEVSPQLFRQCAEHDLSKALGERSVDARTVLISRREAKRDDVHKLVGQLGRNGRVAEVVRVAESPFWVDAGDAWREFRIRLGHEALFEESLAFIDGLGDREGGV